MKLKYLLNVYFEDQTEWLQEAEDVSHIDPKRSHYYDLLQIKKNILAACLIDAETKIPVTAVNLMTGTFGVNGMDVYVGQNALPAMQRELVFFREHQHDMVNTYESATGKLTDQEEGGHRVKYFLGWKVTIAGKEEQQVIGID